MPKLEKNTDHQTAIQALYNDVYIHTGFAEIMSICLGDLRSTIGFLGTLKRVFNIQQFICDCHLPGVIYYSMNCYIAFHCM